MYRSFAIVQNMGWFDNSTQPTFHILERIKGWEGVHYDLLLRSFQTHAEAMDFVRYIQDVNSEGM